MERKWNEKSQEHENAIANMKRDFTLELKKHKDEIQALKDDASSALSGSGNTKQDQSSNIKSTIEQCIDSKISEVSRDIKNDAVFQIMAEITEVENKTQDLYQDIQDCRQDLIHQKQVLTVEICEEVMSDISHKMSEEEELKDQSIEEFKRNLTDKVEALSSVLNNMEEEIIKLKNTKTSPNYTPKPNEPTNTHNYKDSSASTADMQSSHPDGPKRTTCALLCDSIGRDINIHRMIPFKEGVKYMCPNLLTAKNKLQTLGKNFSNVVLLVGTNDTRETSSEEVQQRVIDTLNVAKEHNPTSKIHICTILPNRSNPATHENINIFIRNQAARKNCHVIDLYNHFNGQRGWYRDDIHPNKTGTAEVVKLLKSSVGLKRNRPTYYREAQNENMSYSGAVRNNNRHTANVERPTPISTIADRGRWNQASATTHSNQDTTLPSRCVPELPVHYNTAPRHGYINEHNQWAHVSIKPNQSLTMPNTGFSMNQPQYMMPNFQAPNFQAPNNPGFPMHYPYPLMRSLGPVY